MSEEELVKHNEPQVLLKTAMGFYMSFFGKPRQAYGDPNLGTLARGVQRKRRVNSEASRKDRQRSTMRRLAESSKDPLSASRSMFGAAAAVWQHSAVTVAVKIEFSCY